MSSSRPLTLASVFAFCLLGCARIHVPAVRFENQSIVWEVNDKLDTPEKPEELSYFHEAYSFEHGFVTPVTDALAFHEPRVARSINALDEVPNSTWFENRIGVREMTAAEITHGPGGGKPPDPAGPWTVLSTKQGGASPGFLIEDAEGTRYLLKFDAIEFPEMETGADIVVQRILWAAGYHVPEDYVVNFNPDILDVDPDAYVKDAYGHKTPMSKADVEAVLASRARNPDGTIRGIVSRFLSGVPVGGYPQKGVRPDDPNDTIPHEDRRELRGQYVFFAWLSHTDIKENNWLDMWIEDPGRPGRHYLKHHLVDFGKALGVMATTSVDPPDSYAHNFDGPYALGSGLSLGLWKRPWEGATSPPIRGIGRYEAEHFHPGRYKTRIRFLPFERLDDRDAFWAAKIVMRFKPEHIEAAIAQAQYTDEDAPIYLKRTILKRQRKTGEYWFSRVTPLDEFALRGSLVCAVDLAVRHRFAKARRYEIRGFNEEGRRSRRPLAIVTKRDGTLCFDAGKTGDYAMLRFSLVEGRRRQKPIWLHVAPNDKGRPRIVGIWRE